MVPSQEWSIVRCPNPRPELYLGRSGKHERRRHEGMCGAMDEAAGKALGGRQ